MEESRLKPMQDGYDAKLFNELYERTAQLRKKLISQIDARRLGVDNEELESWFTVKFVYVFNKYFRQKEKDESPAQYEVKKGILLGNLIQSMRLFKQRVLRKAYTKQSTEYYQAIINLDEVEYQVMGIEDPVENQTLFMDLAMSFLEKNLSENAFDLLKLQLQPPPYILTQVSKIDLKDLNKIPSHIISEYYGLGDSKGVQLVNKLRKEIKEAIDMARIHFQQVSY